MELSRGREEGQGRFQLPAHSWSQFTKIVKIIWFYVLALSKARRALHGAVYARECHWLGRVFLRDVGRCAGRAASNRLLGKTVRAAAPVGIAGKFFRSRGL